MKNRYVVGMLLAGVVCLSGCGGSSSDEGTAAPTIGTIGDMPKATSPMASASPSISENIAKAATQGLNLASTSASDFSTSSSMGACEVFNVVKEGIQSASQADMIMCYVQEMQTAFAGLTDATGAVIDVYDGNWHIFNLNLSANPGAPSKVKMRIVKNAAGSITSFVMFMCNILTQIEYTSQTINGTALTMTAKGNFEDSNWTGSHQVDVTGTLNSSGLYTQKSIATRNSGSSSGNANWQEGTLTQTPGRFTLSGYRYGQYTDMTGGQGTAQESAYAAGELLGDTSATITNLAMGDGAVKVDGAYTWTSSGEGDPGAYDLNPFVDAWTGDDGLPVDPATGSSFYAAANAGTLPTVDADGISIAFTAAETWGCNDDVATAVTLPALAGGGAAMVSACSVYGMAGSWINCYQAIQPTF